MFEVLSRSDLSKTAKLVYALLYSAAGRPRLTRQDISTHLTLSIRSVDRALKELLPTGLIAFFGWPREFDTDVDISDSASDKVDKNDEEHDTDVDISEDDLFLAEEVDKNVDNKSDTSVDISEDDPLFQELAEAINGDQQPEKESSQNKIKLALSKSKHNQDQLDQGIDPKTLSHSLYNLLPTPVPTAQHVLPNTLVPEGDKSMQEGLITDIESSSHSSRLNNNIIKLPRDPSTPYSRPALSVTDIAGSVVQPCQSQHEEAISRGAPPPGVASSFGSCQGRGSIHSGRPRGQAAQVATVHGESVQARGHGRVCGVRGVCGAFSDRPNASKQSQAPEPSCSTKTLPSQAPEPSCSTTKTLPEANDDDSQRPRSLPSLRSLQRHRLRGDYHIRRRSFDRVQQVPRSRQTQASTLEGRRALRSSRLHEPCDASLRRLRSNLGSSIYDGGDSQVSSRNGCEVSCAVRNVPGKRQIRRFKFLSKVRGHGPRKRDREETLDRNRQAGDEMVSKLDELRKKARAKAKSKIKTPPRIQSPAQQMAYAYEQVLGEYTHRPALKFIKNWDPEHINAKYFGQAAKIADQLEAPYLDFVWAQFYWFHRWFGREAKPYELRSGRRGGAGSSVTAQDRYTRWVKLTRGSSDVGRVYSSQIPAMVCSKKLDTLNQKRLTRIMTKWEVDEEEAIARFHPLFDENWLKKNPTYRRLRKEGHLVDE